jgi:PiT family inorganic phosphate transporter
VSAVTVGDGARCVGRYQGRFVGVAAPKVVDGVHYLSAGAVCFARAVNDTPKIAALLLAAAGLGLADLGRTGLLLVAVAMTAGGLLQSRKVAETMSRRITDLNPGQGLTANLATAGLVLGASRLGLPVSTTHVSCGTIFGIGLVNRSARGRTIIQILLTWVTTLPLGFLLGGGIYRLLAA